MTASTIPVDLACTNTFPPKQVFTFPDDTGRQGEAKALAVTIARNLPPRIDIRAAAAVPLSVQPGDKPSTGDEIRPNDRLGKALEYRVTEAFEVAPDASWAMDPAREPTTLQTCTPVPTYTRGA